MQFLQKNFWHNPQFKTASWDRPQRQLDIKSLYHKGETIARGEITILKNPLPNTEADNIKGNKSTVFRVFRPEVPDMSECEQKFNELIEVNKRLEGYSSVVAHDLKAPLQSILLNAQMLARSNSQKRDEAAREKFEAIISASKRMAGLIDNLLTQAKLDGKMDQAIEVDTNGVLNNVILNLSAIIEETQAKVYVNDYLPIVIANPTELGQVFQNIISNALKYRSEFIPEVRVCAREIKHYWLFTIEDNGIGINPRDNDKIFESFERLPGARKIEGSGLGLSICKKIIERRGGKIWVESELGQGSTFTVAWPKLSESNAQRIAN
jgi:signal transduction histidine kinase